MSVALPDRTISPEDLDGWFNNDEEWIHTRRIRTGLTTCGQGRPHSCGGIGTTSDESPICPTHCDHCGKPICPDCQYAWNKKHAWKRAR